MLAEDLVIKRRVLVGLNQFDGHGDRNVSDDDHRNRIVDIPIYATGASDDLYEFIFADGCPDRLDEFIRVANNMNAVRAVRRVRIG